MQRRRATPLQYLYMAESKDLRDQALLDMRGRCLSLAADLDRFERTAGATAANDDRLVELRRAIAVLLEDGPNRAERVQMIFSDTTPSPPYGKK
jgi:uncharacterized protein (DUF3084 family)